MMLLSIDRKKIYFYIFLLFILLSIHNFKLVSFFNEFFKINKITLKSDLEDNLNNEIFNTLNQFQNSNIFSLNSKDLKKILDNYNIINDYKIKIQYPSEIKIDLEKTKILAFYIEGNDKIFIGSNKKKIKKIYFENKNIPIIIGKFDLNKFFNLKLYLKNNDFELNNFSKIYSYKSNRWDLLFKNDLLVKLPFDELDESIKILKEIINSNKIENVKIIDLRIKDKVILS